MKHKTKVVMLPTEDEGVIMSEVGAYDTDMILISELPEKLRGYERPHNHLYITVSQDVEPIKEGDWVIYDNGHNSPGFIVKAVKTSDKIVYRLPNETWKDYGHIDGGITPLLKDVRKIIATTDPKLIKLCSCEGTGYDGRKQCMDCKGNGTIKIAQVQQSFLKEYVANPDGEWEVEYEFKRIECHNYNGEHVNKDCSCKSGDFIDIYELKLNQDNTVNITAVEDKMYSMKEVIIISEYVRVCAQSTPNVKTGVLINEYLSIKENEKE